MNMKRHCLLAALAAGIAVGAQTASLWTNRAPTGDWNDPANWSGGVPAANGEACFYRPTGTNFVLSVTPRAAFTGTVTVSNNLAGAAGESYLNTRFHLMLSLGGAEGAQWRVKGNGHLVATPGIADRIAPSFAGLVEVRKGVSFVAPATLGTNVAFIGAGELTLASPAQVHAVWYTNRLFRATDDVGASFTRTPNLPADSRVRKAGRVQTQAGNLSIVFQGVSPTNVILPASMT